MFLCVCVCVRDLRLSCYCASLHTCVLFVTVPCPCVLVCRCVSLLCAQRTCLFQLPDCHPWTQICGACQDYRHKAENQRRAQSTYHPGASRGTRSAEKAACWFGPIVSNMFSVCGMAHILRFLWCDTHGICEMSCIHSVK